MMLRIAVPGSAMPGATLVSKLRLLVQGTGKTRTTSSGESPMPFESGQPKPMELYCASCGRSSDVSADSTIGEFLDRMAEDGAWCPLGDGETIEDNLHSALATQDELCCPACGMPVTISQESLSRFARELLVQW
jgi:hypothetical protein